MAVDSFFNDTTTAIVSALFGGAGVKILDKILSSRSDQFSETAQLRTELRDQNDRLTAELDSTKLEADSWRTKYWALVENDLTLKGELDIVRRENIELRNDSTGK